MKLMVQEYGRYFGLKTGIFSGGCLTGPSHAGAELHGFLSYLIKCFMNKISSSSKIQRLIKESGIYCQKNQFFEAKKIYQEIGGSSPILKLTMDQSNALEKKLNQSDFKNEYIKNIFYKDRKGS